MGGGAGMGDCLVVRPKYKQLSCDSAHLSSLPHKAQNQKIFQKIRSPAKENLQREVLGKEFDIGPHLQS